MSHSVKPEKTVRLRKDGSGMGTMASGSGTVRQKEPSESWLSDAGILISERNLGRKAWSSLLLFQFQCEEAELCVYRSAETPTLPLAPALACIILLEAATSGSSRRSCQGNRGSWSQICRGFASYFRTRFWETWISLPPV